MSLSTCNKMNLFSVNGDAAAITTPVVSYSPCGGMSRVVVEAAYTAVPVIVPFIEFSIDGVNWDYKQNLPVGANPAAGITLYTLDVQIFSWKFVRVTISVPPALNSVRASGFMLPKTQN